MTLSFARQWSNSQFGEIAFGLPLPSSTSPRTHQSALLHKIQDQTPGKSSEISNTSTNFWVKLQSRYPRLIAIYLLHSMKGKIKKFLY